MKLRIGCAMLAFLSLVLPPTALASNTWYVDGVNGSDNNDCKTPQTACKTIGHAISLASSGDSVLVGPATYTENLSISFSLKVVGSGAKTTIIDAGGVGRAVQITASADVILSNLTMRNGFGGLSGGGIYNVGTLRISKCTISGNKAHEDGRSGGGGI
jgi:hypothetical protein